MNGDKDIQNLWLFIESVESHSNDFDLFCDCAARFSDGSHHEKDCMTMKFRMDLSKLQ